MAKYKTAQGKVVDMSALASRNEKTRAVGNMKVNARGDTIDSTGRIIKPATTKVNETYAKTVGNRSAQPVRQQVKADPLAQAQARARQTQRTVPTGGINSKIAESDLSSIEKDLEESMEDDIEVEKIKAKETRKN